MVSRRTLLAGGITAASLFSSPGSACTARRLFIPNARDRTRMLDKARQFQTAYNRDRLVRFLGPEEGITVHGDYIRKPEALSEFRRTHGKMLTPVTDDNAMILPEDAKLFFVTSMELDPPSDLTPEEENLARGLMCTPSGWHVKMLVAHRWAIDQRTHRIEFGRLPLIEIGWLPF